jgi:histidinol dehydrogenase
MRTRYFDWEGALDTAKEIRVWNLGQWPNVEDEVTEINRGFLEAGTSDAYLLELTARFDATDNPPTSLQVDEADRLRALSRIDPGLRESLEFAASNIRLVAEAQVRAQSDEIRLPQGQVVNVREVPLDSAGIYAPGGRAAYPSSVLMCAIPAMAAGVERIVLATPPGPDGRVNPVVLAAAALCEIDEIYALGGAQAIFALACGTRETISPVSVVAGPGNVWVREAKRQVVGLVAIDSLAGPSELMVVVDETANLTWAALDLCAQAEHGDETPLVAAAADADLLDRLARETERAAASRSGVWNAPLALVQVPDLDSALDLANYFAPEHLELLVDDGTALAAKATTAGCVFAGPYSATAFGDYVAGSNHVLPTGGAGRFSGPLSPSIFRRKIATVEIPAEAVAKLAPHADRIARAEGFPVHGESAMIRAEENA